MRSCSVLVAVTGRPGVNGRMVEALIVYFMSRGLAMEEASTDWVLKGISAVIYDNEEGRCCRFKSKLQGCRTYRMSTEPTSFGRSISVRLTNCLLNCKC